MWAVKRLRQYLVMILFDIYTDHSPLTSLFRVGASNAKVQRWVEFLTGYNYRIIHRKCAAHGTARTMSIRLSCWLKESRQHICVTMSNIFPMIFFCNLYAVRNSTLRCTLALLAPKRSRLVRGERSVHMSNVIKSSYCRRRLIAHTVHPASSSIDAQPCSLGSSTRLTRLLSAAPRCLSVAVPMLRQNLMRLHHSTDGSFASHLGLPRNLHRPTLEVS